MELLEGGEILDVQPVMMRTGPVKAFFGAALPRVNNSPTVTGCLVFSPTSRSIGSK